jgi:hypothetical protein
MPAALKKQSGSYIRQASPKSRRLRELNEEAAKVRELHSAGKLSDNEVQVRLKQLKSRYRGFLDRVLALS